MNKKYIISLDQGTTSSRAVVLNRSTGNISAIETLPFKQIYPKPGWVEHNAIEIWNGQIEVLKRVVKKTGINTEEIACIGITNQRETVVVWDKNTGKPVYNAIVWQCRRTAAMCEDLKNDGLNDVIQQKTGLVIDAYFSATKIKWILDSDPNIRKMAEAGELLVGTIDTWLIWNLTQGKVHVTDISNASRTMLFNINKLEWDVELLEHLNIPACILPTVVASSGYIGETSEKILGIKIPISGIAGDQQAALFGQCCYEKGSAKNTYGTGCFILMNTGNTPVFSKHRLLTTIGWKIGKNIEYALEGSVFNAGSAIQWLRDELQIIKTADECEIEAEKVSSTGGIYFVPAFTGLGAPYWDMYARGTIAGITRGTGRSHIIRAALESIAYQSKDILEVMQMDSGLDLKELKVDGGASVNRFMMQFQSDIMNVIVKRPKIIETTALGAAYLAGIGVGLWNGKDDIIKEWKLDKTFTPNMSNEDRETGYWEWKRAVKRAMG